MAGVQQLPTITPIEYGGFPLGLNVSVYGPLFILDTSLPMVHPPELSAVAEKEPPVFSGGAMDNMI